MLQEFNDCKIIENFLEISFNDDNFKEILNNSENIFKINDIIKEYNLKVKYNFTKLAEEKNIEDILKEKFEKINIKE